MADKTFNFDFADSQEINADTASPVSLLFPKVDAKIIKSSSVINGFGLNIAVSIFTLLCDRYEVRIRFDVSKTVLQEIVSYISGAVLEILSSGDKSV